MMQKENLKYFFLRLIICQRILMGIMNQLIWIWEKDTSLQYVWWSSKHASLLMRISSNKRNLKAIQRSLIQLLIQNRIFHQAKVIKIITILKLIMPLMLRSNKMSKNNSKESSPSTNQCVEVSQK